MSPIDKTGGPAFGTVINIDAVRVEMTGEVDYEPTVTPGNLTVRDYFAAKAMQGFCAAQSENWTHGEIAQAAFDQADAMLKVRK